MSMNEENYEIDQNKSDIEILSEIEQLLSISIPQKGFSRDGITSYKLHRNHITELAIYSVNCQVALEKIFTLVHLEKLVLNYTEIIFIPESIKNLNNLIELSFKSNSLDFIPDALLDLPNLRALNLSRNKIQSLITKEGQLPLIKSLEIEHNTLEIADFKENSAFLLESLLVNNNRIENLNISNLINLKYFSANFNHLTKIPEISNLIKLDTIELDCNAIKEFTITENDLNKIVNFSIRFNKISSIDFAITKKINYFFYKGNPLDKKSAKLLKQYAKTRSSNLFYS